MIKIDAILEYIESIKNSYLNGRDSREISTRIKSIQNKRKDNKLYLAVIGEFSSGKSTFINALLGFRLLKEAVMPTTACATYIECHSRVLSIDVSFFDGSNFKCNETNFGDIRGYLSTKYSLMCDDLFQVITILTSHQKVACTVNSLRLYVPVKTVPKNIVIIDTPGFNPGSTSTENHQEITKNIVENIADSAIILTSQEQAMSATLSKFLNTNFSRCLHRCTYVVTKMDILEDEKSRAEVMDYARQRIIQDLKVTKPQVYGLSAVTMLPIKQVPIGKESDWPVFRRAFVDFMTLTWVRLQNSKEYVLSEHVNILVKDVALSCAEKLRLKQKELQKDKSFLQSHRIETIQAVCEIMVKNSLNAINEVISSVHYSFSTAESSSRSDAKSIIESGIMNPDRFNNVMIPQIRSSVESAAGNVLQDLNASINGKVKKRVKEELSKMSDVFESHYSQFQSLKPKETAPTVDLIKFNNPMLNFNIALNKIKELDSEENEAAGGGALAGASIGFLVGGPVGAFFGALGGAVFGLGAGDQSDSMRASAIPLVQNEISAFFSSLRIKVADEISSIKSKYVNLINQYAKDHVLKYGNSVQELIKKHEDRIREKDSKISSLKVAIRNLQNIQDDVEHELLILKIK